MENADDQLQIWLLYHAHDNMQAIFMPTSYEGVPPSFVAFLDTPVRICYNAGMPADYLNFARNMLFKRELLIILEECRKKNIDIMVIKGPAYAETLYERPSMRQYSDIDLLIKEKDLEKAKEIMLALNYCLVGSKAAKADNIHQIAVKKTQKMDYIFEVHWRLHPKNIDLINHEEAWAESREIEIEGQKVKTLSVHHSILYLLYHLNRHHYNCMTSFRDLDLLMRKYKGEINWEKIARSEYKALLYFGMDLTSRLLHTDFPKDVLKKLRPALIKVWLFNCFFGLERISKKQDPVYAGKIFNKSLLLSGHAFRQYLGYRLQNFRRHKQGIYDRDRKTA